MKKYILGALVLFLIYFSASVLFGGELAGIRRIKRVPNPFPALIPGEEVLEVKFAIHEPSWVDGVGWSVRLYDQKKELTDVVNTAYFLRAETPVQRIRDHSFKGRNNFTAYFPLPSDPAFIVMILVAGREIEVALLPSSRLIEEFAVPREEIETELLRSDYRFLEAD